MLERVRPGHFSRVLAQRTVCYLWNCNAGNNKLASNILLSCWFAFFKGSLAVLWKLIMMSFKLCSQKSLQAGRPCTNTTKKSFCSHSLMIPRRRAKYKSYFSYNNNNNNNNNNNSKSITQQNTWERVLAKRCNKLRVCSETYRTDMHLINRRKCCMTRIASGKKLSLNRRVSAFMAL